MVYVPFRKKKKNISGCKQTPLYPFPASPFQLFFVVVICRIFMKYPLECSQCVKHSPVINNPRPAEKEGDGEWAMSLFIQKLFCFALEQDSDTVGGENQSSQPGGIRQRRKWEPWEALIIVTDLSQRLCGWSNHKIISHFVLWKKH